MARTLLLQHLLAESAQRRPEAQALCFGAESLSYGELERASNRLARVLREQGVRRGDRVAILTPKSPASIVAIHGILKSGAAYVPLDPGAPAPRLAYILGNCAVRHVVASTRKAETLDRIAAEGAALESVVFADAGPAAAAGLRTVAWSEVLAHPGEGAPANPSIGNDLAYILYTSGSTGTPKGVMITHANALAFVDWAVEQFSVGPADRLSSHAPLHFDLSIFDVFGALMAGAALALVPDGTSTFPIRLAEWIANNRITVWYSVPSILTLLLLKGRLDRVDLSSLRLVLFAGEVFPTKYLRGVMAALPHADFCNLYGPTETNVITWYRVPRLAEGDDAPIPIGVACDYTDLLIVGEDGQLVSEPGREGELYARGPTVAQGYWGDAEKTARAFVANPFQTAFAERVYRTGDLVALAPDGNLRFLGRRDRMVKSRGYRIELDEIETTLYAHPEVKEAAVVAVPDEQIGARLRAFVACGGTGPERTGSIRDHCLQRLPRYMVPESIELLDVLPKTSTGKIDRTQLARRG
jgi:amino acid adenylation domain-containing protein